MIKPEPGAPRCWDDEPGCNCGGYHPDDRLYPLRPFSAAEVDHLIAFECAPYPVELLMPQQHRMEPSCWCAPIDLGDNAWQHRG